MRCWTRTRPCPRHCRRSCPDLRGIRDAHARDVADIKVLLEGKGSPDEEHIVSPEELKFLMTSDDERPG